MTANQFERHRKARQTLKDLLSHREKVVAIHYSCESFHDLPDGRSPRITSIAVRNFDTGQSDSFSIHQMAEIHGLPMSGAEIETEYNKLENEMLAAFYDYIKNHASYTFLHWNMRDMKYGFQAIDHRCRVLGGAPLSVPDDKKVDLSRLLVEIYGDNYMEPPRLENVVKTNGITDRDFLPGAQEAVAFVERRYLDLHRSTLRKVHVFCVIAELAHDERLKTHASWKESHGISLATIAYLIKKHPIFAGISILGTVCGAVVGVVKLVLELLSLHH